MKRHVLLTKEELQAVLAALEMVVGEMLLSSPRRLILQNARAAMFRALRRKQ